MGRDVVDTANELVEHEITTLINNHARQRVATTLPMIGRCHNCEEDVTETLFCDADCREDYDRRMAKRRRDGR